MITDKIVFDLQEKLSNYVKSKNISNTKDGRSLMKNKTRAIFKKYVDRNENLIVTCDETNNPPSVIENKELVVKVDIWNPTKNEGISLVPFKFTCNYCF